MRGSNDSDPLLAALDELAALGSADDRTELDALRGRLREQRLRVLVAGEAKRGKSTLVNALLGRAVLPAGITPLTALATTVRYGRDENVRAVFTDGHAENLPLSALEDLVTERGNPGNRHNVASVTVTVDAPILARGIELVDTPGTGSVYTHNTSTAEAALDTMDAAVFVLTADPPASASECELLARVAGGSVRMFVVLNKTDYLAGDELAEALDFATQVAGRLLGSRCGSIPSRRGPPSRRAPALIQGSRRSGRISLPIWTGSAHPTCACPPRRTRAAWHVRCRMKWTWRAGRLRCGPGTPQSGSGRLPRGSRPWRCAAAMRRTWCAPSRPGCSRT